MKVKKLAIIVILIATLFIITGCATKTIDEKGVEREIDYGLIVIGKLYDKMDGDCKLAYDPVTKVCYMVINSLYRAGITPYYIIGKDGKPEIAIYGVNYE